MSDTRVPVDTPGCAMSIVDRCGPAVSGFAGGAVAAFAIRESQVQDYELARGVWSVLVTPQWAGTAAALTAVGVLAVLSMRGSRLLTALTAVVGAIVIALPAFVGVAASPAVTLNAVGAGVLLAAAASTAAGGRAGLVAVAVGVLGTTLFYGAAALWRTRLLRWSVTLPDDPTTVPAAVPVLVAVTAAIVIVGAAIRASPDSVPGFRRRDVVVSVGLPLVFTVLYAWLGSTSASTVSWTVAVVLSAAATLAAARWLPLREGRFLLVGLAIAATSVNEARYFAGSWWLVLAGIVLLAAGAAVGWFRPAPGAGMVLLAAVTVTGVMSGSATFESVLTVAYVGVLPFAVGLTVSSCLPASALIVVTGVLMPLTVTLFAVSAPVIREFVWSNGYPAPGHYPLVAVAAPLPSGILVATVTVVLVLVAVTYRSSPVRLPSVDIR
ncbi:hypothetical protein [Rhodococcus marinonascens]|uniref:hypothetical protein n=1 Tax=Rhodococcus marinonascens TaxID=38311 RepID=UPI000A9A5589|nr:hypothetical protein [Rhodococcus marinonascens]